MRYILSILASLTIAQQSYALDLAQTYEQAFKNDPQWAATTNQYLAEKKKNNSVMVRYYLQLVFLGQLIVIKLNPKLFQIMIIQAVN